MKQKLLYLFIAFLGLTALQKSAAQVTVSASLGTASGSYTTLGGAFAKINDGTHRGVINITITANTTEATTALLDSSGNPTNSNYTNVIIRPQVGSNIVVSGNIANPLIDLNGADRVNIDGLNNGFTSLTFSNTNTGNTASVIRFINDASNNQVLNTTIRGLGSSPTLNTLGIVFFSTGLLTGNDGNKIANCNVDCQAIAAAGIMSVGTTTTPTHQNSNDTISNCNIFDFFNPSLGNPVGLSLGVGNTDWLISGNSLYQTTNRTVTAQGTHIAISILPAYTTDAHKIIGNFVGGTAPGATGMLTYSAATVATGFIGYSIQTGGPGNLIENNTCQNVTCNWSLAAGSFGNAGFSLFIGGYSGTTTLIGNTVKNLTFFNSAGAALGSAIVCNGRVTTASTVVRPVFNVTNNTIENITFNAGGTGSAQFYGIRYETSSAASLTGTATIANPVFNISGNTITNLNSTTGGASGWIRGIGALTTNGGSGATLSNCPLLPKANIENNTISQISCFSSLASAATNVAVGIQLLGFANAIGPDTSFVKGNTIFNINSTNTADLATTVAGIIGTSGIYSISENKIYGLNNASSGATTAPLTSGINLRSSQGGTGVASNIFNNFISIGSGNTNNVSYVGILNNFTAPNPINVYFNSVFIGGSVAAGGNKSAAFHRGNELFTTAITTQIDLKNNILINQRSGGSSVNYAVSSFGPGTWTSNNNNFQSSNPATLAFWDNADQTFAGFQTASAGDANSTVAAVNFVNTALGDLHITGASNGDANLRGVSIAGITTDIDGAVRNAFNPYKGADEGSISLPVQLISFNAQLRSTTALLSWNTTNEVNLAAYVVERNINGDWATVTTIAPKGNANNAYTASDANLSNGKHLYRLKMIDKDGKFSYSNIITLEVSSKNLFVLNQNYPNPVKGTTQFSYQLSGEGKVIIDLFTQDGRRVASLINQQQAAGTYSFSVDIKKYGLATGNYNYRMIVVDKNNQELYRATKTMVVTQ